MSFSEWSNKKKKEREEEEKKSSQSSSSSTTNDKEEKPSSFTEWSNKKHGGKKGWEQYLADQSSAEQKKNEEYEEKPWWQKAMDTIGEWYGPTGPADTTLPLGSTPQLIHDVRNDTSYTKPSDDWSDEQRYEFGALYLESPEKAFAYAEKTNNANNKAKEEAEIKKVQDSATSNGWAGAAHTAGAIASAGLGLADYLNMLVLSNAGRDPLESDGVVSPFEYSTAVTEGIGTHLNETYGTLDEDIPIIGGKGWGDVYSLGTSIAQSAVSGYTLGPAGTLVSYFGQGAASGMKDALNRGASEGQAAWYGAALGAFEGVAETIGIDNLFKLGSSSTIKGLLKNILQQAKAEGLEEGFTSVLSNIADAWIMQDKSNFNAMLNAYMEAGMSEKDAKWAVFWDSLEGIAFDMIAGAVSGGVHGGLQTGIQTGKYSSYVKNAYGDQTQDIVNDALNSPHSSVQEIGQKYQEKLDSGKSLSGWNLYELLETTDSNKIKDATLKRLGELGETSDVTAVAEVLVKQAMGQELSSKDQNILNNSKYGNLVSTELMHENILSDGLFDKWSENIGTRMVSPEVYNKGKNVVAEDFPNKLVTKGVPKESKYKSSESGKTTLKDQEVSIQGIESIEGGEVTVRLENGDVVNASDLEFGSDTVPLMYDMVAKMGVSTNTANELIQHFQPSDAQQASLYYHAIPLAYNYGKIGYNAGLKYITSLSEQDKNYAYRKGVIDAMIEDDAKKNAPHKSKVTNKVREGSMSIEEAQSVAGLTDRQKDSINAVKALSDSLGINIRFFESKVGEDGKRIGANGMYDTETGIVYIDIHAGLNGEGTILYTAAHELTHLIREWSPAKFKVFADFLLAEYGKKNISVDALIRNQIDKAKRNGRDIDFDTAYEEVIADSCESMLADGDAISKIAKLKAKDKSLWQTIKDFITDLVAKIKEAYKGLTPDSVEGRFVGEMLDAATKLKTLWTEALIDAGENYSEVRDALGKGSSIEVNENGEFTVGKTKDGKLLYNDRTYDEGGRETLKETLIAEGFSSEDIKAALTIIDAKHNLVKKLGKEFSEQDKVNKATLTTDLKDGHAVLSALVSNGDYPVNIDLLMVCKKRLAYQRVINRLCETGLIKQATLDSLAIAEINKILGKYGFETACLGCFVESRRIRIQEWAETICKEWNGIVDKMVGKGKAETFNFASETFVKDLSNEEIDTLSNELEETYARDGLHYGKTSVVNKMRQLLVEVPSLRKHLSVADLITPQGRTHLKSLSAELNSLVACRYGSNTPKIVQDFNPYNHEIAKYGKVPSKYSTLREYLYAIGGARMQSFSDFIVENWFDYCQIVADLAARKLPMHTYTKEISLVKLFGMTGIKVNMSLIPDIDRTLPKEFAGLTKNAKGEYELIWADKDRFKATGGKSYMQSINFADALAIQADPRYSANVGTIAVGISDKHIEMMLDDARIRMVIPYHSSGMNPIFANLVGTDYYNDYTNYQNTTVKHLINSKGEYVDLALTKDQKGKLTAGFEFNEVLQRLGDARAAAEEYKAWCADASLHTMTINGETYTAVLSPKFEKFADHQNYYKLLEDFNTYDCITEQPAPQGDVQQIYPDEFDKVLKDELKSRENYRNKQEPKWETAMGEIESYLKKHTKADTIAYAKEHGIKLSKKDMKLSDRTSYAPTFYSYMGKVIDNIKLDKMGAGGVVPYLKGKGVKNEEIKWSGIETFLEGKKSVTKAELQEFVAGSQLQIVEQMSDDEEYTRWSDYKLEGGSNYRELVFQMPDSSYSNRAMRGHWGEDAEGVLVHARIQDMTTSDGKKMLFVEEIQSDWHNEGLNKGYSTKEYEDAVESQDKLYNEYKKFDLAFHKYVRSNEFMTDPEDVRKKKHDWLRGKAETAQKKYLDAEKVVDSLKGKGAGDTPDAPFKNNYHEYVLKRLLRMAAEEGYDSIGWTPADIQSDRWSHDYAEAYRIEYDQDIPKFLKKYGKQWGATVGKVTLPDVNATKSVYDVNRQEQYSSINKWQEIVYSELKAQGLPNKKLENLDFFEDRGFMIAHDAETGMEYDRAEIRETSNSVWSMDITDSMKDSVLHEGQVLYSDRVTDQETLDFLENQEHVTVYRAMQVIDGELYPPMAAKVKSTDGKKTLVTPSKIGKWEQAVERPDLIRNGNKFELDKANGSSIQAAYNPYFHTSASPLNDQFSSAYKRPNLVIVEGEIPSSELTSGYRAEFAKDTVGETKWHSGPVASKLKGDKARRVFLSRWFKPVRIVPDSEVASIVAKTLEGENIDVPYNVVTPSLRTELEKVGVSIKYSERDTETISNRTLLANALDTVAQNDIEKTKLAQYREKIALIESEQVKLSKIRAEIKELSFAKGPRDTARIKSLQFEANQAANRINTYDRQLLNLESTKALKGVLDREKEMARKKAEQMGKESLRRQKEKDAATVRELLARNYESRKKATENRNKTAMRHKIRGVVSDLNKLLLNPTKDQHVPIGLQKVVADALDAINMDTMNAEERVAYYNDLISKSNNPDEIAMLKKKQDFFEYRDMNFKDRITSLKSAYAEFKESDDPLIRNAHNDAIEDLIKNTADEVGNNSLKDMSLTQLERVYDMYKAILATVRNANKMFKEGRQETVTENSDAVKLEVREVGGHKDRVLKMTKFLKKFGWDMLKPVTAMKVIGSKTFERLFKNVRAAEDTWAVDVGEAKRFYEDVAAKYGYNKWDMKKRYSFKDGAGSDVSMSLEQIMSLYAYSKREQADKHLEFGGFIFDDAIEITEKKLGVPLKYEVNDANPHRLRKEDLFAIIDALTKEQKGFVDEMQTYLSDVMGAKGNEVSLAMYDIKLYKEKNYFPLKTSRYFREFDPEKSATPKIKNSGFSKKTVPQAGNPIVLSNFMDVWAGHVNDMSMYHAFVLPLEDFMRVYNYSSTAGGYDSVQQYIKNAYGSQANQYIEKLMDDLNGGARVDSSAGVINKGLSLFKKASVFASASVVVQQPSAMARALAYINPKYFATSAPSALNVAKHKTLWEEVKKYAPVAVIKEMGYFDTGMGRSTVEWIKGNQTFMDKMDDVLSKAPAIADELCWTHIWEAIKRETQATTKFDVNSEEFLERCGQRFTEVITNTQVYDSVLSRSGMMRSKDTGMKMATAFMAEPTTTVNMMVDGILQGKRGNKSFTAKTVGAISASIILNSILVALVYAARDDDEDETYLEKYVGSLTSELLDGFNPLTYIPFVKDVWSIAQGYDVERSDMSVVSNLWSSIEGLFNENTSGLDKVTNAAGAIASLFGLPLKNILRDAKGMYNLTQTILSGTPTTGAGIGEAVEDAFKSSIPLWDRLHESDSKADRLYKAILSGDQAHIDRVKATFKDQSAIDSALKSALRANDSRIHDAAQARLDGNISEYTRIAREIIAEGHFSQDIVVAAINSEMNAIKKGESTQTESTDSKDEATSIYRADDINIAFDNGDTDLALSIIDELVEMKMANGMDEKKAKSSIRSSMTSYWKPLYKQAYASGNTSEMQRIKQILYKSGLYGSASEVIKDVNSWLKN